MSNVESLKQEVENVRQSVESTKEKLNKIKDEYSIFELASEEKRHELVKKCMQIAKPDLLTKIDSINNLTDKLSKYGENGDTIKLKKDFIKSLKEIKTAFEKMGDNGDKKDKESAKRIIVLLSAQIRKLS